MNQETNSDNFAINLGMLDKNLWLEKVQKAYSEACSDSMDGFKLLYCKWKLIYSSELAFISLNPGRAPDRQGNCLISDEDGNSYLREKDITKSAMTKQFLKICEGLKIPAESVLTGVVIPFRTNRERDLNHKTREIGNVIGGEFWSVVLDQQQLRNIIVVGNSTMKVISSIKGLIPIVKYNTGWGKTRIRVYEDSNKKRYFHLPHLSSYQLFSNQKYSSIFFEAFSQHSL